MQVSDVEDVKKAVDNARNAAMKIGQSMNQSGGSTNSSESSSSSEDQSEKKEEEKKN